MSIFACIRLMIFVREDVAILCEPESNYTEELCLYVRQGSFPLNKKLNKDN